MRAFIACHIPDRQSRVQSRIWPDLAFSLINKRSGYEIKVWEAMKGHDGQDNDIQMRFFGFD